MQAIAKTTCKYWQEEEFWIGYLEEYPDYMTQGTRLEGLKKYISDLYKDTYAIYSFILCFKRSRL